MKTDIKPERISTSEENTWNLDVEKEVTQWDHRTIVAYDKDPDVTIFKFVCIGFCSSNFVQVSTAKKHWSQWDLGVKSLRWEQCQYDMGLLPFFPNNLNSFIGGKQMILSQKQSNRNHLYM